MFKKSPEHHIVIEADKVASMKESLDALSWDRVAEIGKQLQASPTPEEQYELGRELLSIAQANTSLLGKLGIATTSFTGKLMPSGVELLQNDRLAVTLPSGKPVFPDGESVGHDRSQQREPDGVDAVNGAEAGYGKEAVSAIPFEELSGTALAAKESALASLYEAKESTAIIPDVANIESDFFAVPSSSADTFIPRGSGAATVTGAAGVFTGFEHVHGDGMPTAPIPGVESNAEPHAGSYVGSYAEPDARSHKGPEQVSSHQSVFGSVLEFIQKEQPKDASSAQRPTTAPAVSAVDGDTAAAAVSANQGQEDPIAGQGIDSEQEYEMARNALNSEALMAEFGIDSEARAEPTEELEEDRKLLAADTEQKGRRTPEEAAADSVVQPSSEACGASDSVVQPSSEACGASDYPVVDAVSAEATQSIDGSIDMERADVQIFSGKEDSIAADLERKAEKSRKCAEFAEKKDSDNNQHTVKAKKITKQDLAGFRQIYASRDGALNFYVDSAGHVVAVDPARLA